MPMEGIDFLSRSEILTYDEIIRLARVFKQLGISKVRLTGGEPMVRRDVFYLIERLSEIFDSFHITTNATLLHKHWDDIERCNITSFNISIDSLDRNRYQMITRRDDFDQVMSNIHRAMDLGWSLKLNMVVMKGVNDGELMDMMSFGMTHHIPVRFIEAMPFNDDDGNRLVFMDHNEMVERISSGYNIEPIQKDMPSSAINYITESGNEFDVIPAYSRSLCGTCNRIRLTPKGELLTCLYAQNGLDVKSLLRDRSISDVDIALAIKEAVWQKSASGTDEENKNQYALRSMTTIGG